jgi:H+-transporting ATPase
MTPLGWGWALFVWGYAIVWALLNDRFKLLAYRILDPGGRARTATAGRPAAPSSAAAEPGGADADKAAAGTRRAGSAHGSTPRSRPGS